MIVTQPAGGLNPGVTPRYYFACQGCGACGPLRADRAVAVGDSQLHTHQEAVPRAA